MRARVASFSGTGLAGHTWSCRRLGRVKMDEQFRSDDPRLAGLWRAVAPHPVNPEDIGQYVALWRQRGAEFAAEAFPSVARHLADGCRACHALRHQANLALAEVA